MTTTWLPLDNGTTIGQTGSESGVILRDDEHPLGARITLERDGDVAPYAITCGIRDRLMHTRLLSSEAVAMREYDLMRQALSAILADLSADEASADDERKACTESAIERVVERFR